MDTSDAQLTDPPKFGTGLSTSIRPQVVGSAALTALLALVAVVTVAGAAESAAPIGRGPAAAVPAEPAVVADAFAIDAPDTTGDEVGGIAARLYADGDTSLSGDLFLLLAVEGSDAAVRVWDDTPYMLRSGDVHPEVVASNEVAVNQAASIVGEALSMVDFTSAPGGGLSAGLTYAIAYLNIVSDGAFTGDLTVASTGRLEDDGYVQPITAIDEKVAAAYVAVADVVFMPSKPADDTIDAYGARFAGELFRVRHTGTPIADERRWDTYDSWGEQRPAVGMDLIAVRHVGDVAAYLCGAGSDYACTVRASIETLDDVTQTDVRAVTPSISSQHEDSSSGISVK